MIAKVRRRAISASREEAGVTSGADTVER